MTSLLADIDFGTGGNSDAYLAEGWGEQEPRHRWTMGRESRVRLPAFGSTCVLAIDATPCLHPPGLRAQTVMLSIGDRLLATAIFPGLRVFAFRLPQSLAGAENPVLTITHLNGEAPRAPEQMRHGQPLGLMVHSIRLYALDRPRRSLQPQVADGNLALCFESLGQGCQFGLIQRQMGADPLSLLRFVDTVTSSLVDGLVRNFAGIDNPSRLSLSHASHDKPSYIWHQADYKLSFDTLIGIDESDPDTVLRGQVKRLAFLRRKFVDDLRAARKIYVLTRSDVLTEAEALAVFCALTLHGPNTLLWTVFGDDATTGQVVECAPGFLRGELGRVDQVGYAPLAVWRTILEKARMRVLG